MTSTGDLVLPKQFASMPECSCPFMTPQNGGVPGVMGPGARAQACNAHLLSCFWLQDHFAEAAPLSAVMLCARWNKADQRGAGCQARPLSIV